MEKNVLIVSISGEDIDTDFIRKLRAQLKEQLPNHDVAVICVGLEGRVDVVEIKR